MKLCLFAYIQAVKVEVEHYWPRGDGRQTPWPFNSCRTPSPGSWSLVGCRGVHDRWLAQGEVCTPHVLPSVNAQTLQQAHTPISITVSWQSANTGEHWLGSHGSHLKYSRRRCRNTPTGSRRCWNASSDVAVTKHRTRYQPKQDAILDCLAVKTSNAVEKLSLLTKVDVRRAIKCGLVLSRDFCDDARATQNVAIRRHRRR